MNLDSADSGPNNLLSQTDAELFRALKAGQSSALGILYDRYVSLVYRLALRILTNPQEAEDLTQEIFLTLWRSGTYNPPSSEVTALVVTVEVSPAPRSPDGPMVMKSTT